MKRILSKATAVVMVCVFVLSYLPPITAFADAQKQVTDLMLLYDNASNAPSYSTTYKIGMSWTNPMTTNTHDNIIDPSTTFLYDIVYKKGSTATGGAESTYFSSFPDSGAAAGNVISPKDVTNLDPSSIYVFRADAHHSYTTTNASGVSTTTTMKANGKPSLFLTDIIVSAEGAGNTITVTWDNPTLDGRDVFEGYNLYYRRTNSTVPMSTVYENSSVVSVKTADCKIAGGKLKYTIVSNNILPFTYYDVAVMPTVGDSGTPLRGDGANPNQTVGQVTVGTQTYNIAYPARNVRPYATNQAYVKFPVYVEDSTDGNIRLYWDKLSDSAIHEVYIWENSVLTTGDNLLGILSGPNATGVNYWFTTRPGVITSYRIEITYTNSSTSMFSMWAVYNPAYSDFLPYRPNITEISTNNARPLRIDLKWKAFTRSPYNTNETTNSIEPGVYLDKNVIYDFWVSDNLDLLSDSSINAIAPLRSLNAANLRVEAKNTNDTVNPYVYSSVTNNSPLTQYVTLDSTGVLVTKALDDNKVYYVRVVARMANDETKKSVPAFAAIYIEPLGDISTNPIMLTSPPLSVKNIENINGVNSITIQWDTRWFELYDSATKAWYSEAGLDSGGNLVFGALANADGITKILPVDPVRIEGTFDPNTVIADIQLLTPADSATGIKPPVRYMDLKDSDYVIHTVRYDTIAATVDPTQPNPYMAYINRIISNNALWSDIAPTGDYPHLEFTLLTQQAPTAAALASNMPYVIFLRPVSNGLYAYYPAYVAATTLNDQSILDIIPTVPNLEDAGKVAVKDSTVPGISMNVPATDTSITVRWEANTNLTYELAFSELQANYPNGGTRIAINANNVSIRQDPDTLTVYYYYTLDGLFPETYYYIWVRAIAGKNISAWSNPLYLNTKDMDAPPVPQGLGIASSESVKAYNEERNATLASIAPDYVILEWLLNGNDPGPKSTAFSVTGGNVELLSPALVTSTYMVKFNGLLPYTSYYARVKTVATVTKGGQGGGTAKVYSYVLQLALTDDFIDPIEITIPPLVEITSANEAGIRRKESAWSDVIRISSGKTTTEFDGDKNPALYPLPVDDFEITYDSSTRTLNYRFRSAKTDSSGNKDNGVDQRFISKLIANKVYTYNLDLTSYENNIITNRVIEIPYSILKAFEERKISLRCKMGSIYITILPGAVLTAEVKALGDLGANTSVKIAMDDSGSGMPALQAGSSYATYPQRLSMQVISPSKTIELVNATKAISVDLLVNKSLVSPARNLGGYYAVKNSQTWENAGGIYDAQSGVMSFTTPKVASYSSISKPAPTVSTPTTNAATAASNSKYTDAINVVNRKVNMSDISSIDVNGQISANQFNKIIEAVASNKNSVTINQALTDSEYQSLGRSGMLVSGLYVTREVGIASLVKLYEVKTKKVIKGYPTEATTAYPDIKNATAAYRQALLKAEYLDFYDTKTVNPKGSLTFGEFLRMLSYVIEDSAG